VPLRRTRSGGTPELLGNGRYGVLVPPRDDEALAAALVRLMEAPAEREALGQAAQAYAAETFTMAAQLEALENVLGVGPAAVTRPSR